MHRSVRESVALCARAERTSEGRIVLTVGPCDDERGLTIEPAILAVVLRLEGGDVIRVSLRDARTGAIAYLQGKLELVAFAHQLGLRFSRQDEA